MAAVTISAAGKTVGDDVLSGTIHLPRVGAWVADLKVAADVPLSGPVDITIGHEVIVGTVSRSGMVQGIAQTRVVAGADGLRSQVGKMHYTAPSVRNVLARIAKDVGESLSAAGDRTVLDRQLEHWSTLVMPAAQAIRALVHVLPEGTVWRILADGGLWIGLDTWPDAGLPDVAIVGERAEDAMIELALEAPFLLPGTTVVGRRVDTVELSFGAGGASAKVWTVP